MSLLPSAAATPSAVTHFLPPSVKPTPTWPAVQRPSFERHHMARSATTGTALVEVTKVANEVFIIAASSSTTRIVMRRPAGTVCVRVTSAPLSAT